MMFIPNYTSSATLIGPGTIRHGPKHYHPYAFSGLPRWLHLHLVVAVDPVTDEETRRHWRITKRWAAHTYERLLEDAA